MNLNKVKKNCPKAYELYKNRTIKDRVDYFDSIGIRILFGYGANGGFNIEIRRKKTKEESEGDHDWKMIRHGYLGSYQYRNEATDAGIEHAFDLHEELLNR